MKQQAQCFCIKVIPYSVKTESHIISVPAPEPFSSETEGDEYEEEEKIECQNAYKFLSSVLADFLWFPNKLKYYNNINAKKKNKGTSSSVDSSTNNHD